MQSYDELGELLDLLLMMAYHGMVRAKSPEGVEGVAQIPGKESQHNEGLEIKNQRAYNVYEGLDSDIRWMIHKANRQLETMLEGTRN